MQTILLLEAQQLQLENDACTSQDTLQKHPYPDVATRPYFQSDDGGLSGSERQPYE